MSSILEQEIRSQPHALTATLTIARPPLQTVAEAVRARGVHTVMIAARGTSDHAADYARYLLGNALGMPVALAAPSLSTLYRSESLLDARRRLVVGISQSGASPDIRAVVADARRAGALTVAMTNDASSPLAQSAEHVVDLGVGPELAVAATKTYTSSLLAVALLAEALGGEPLGTEAVPAFVAEAVDSAFAQIERLDALRGGHLVVLGRGVQLPTAYETALKVRELCGVVSEGFSPPDLQHGPIAGVPPGATVLAFAPHGAIRESMLAAMHDLRRRGLEVVEVSDDPAADLSLPQRVPEWLAPIPAIAVGQVLAWRWATLDDRDVDAPPGLTKITQTT